MIPWATDAEWRSVNRHLTEILTGYDAARVPARRTARRIHERMAALAPAMDRLAAATCSRCPSPCCLTADVWFDRLDLLRIHLLHLPAPPAQPRSSRGQICRYLGPRGCRLPRDRRPWICTWYLCPVQTRRLRAASGGRTPSLMDDLATIQRLRRELAATVEAVLGRGWEQNDKCEMTKMRQNDESDGIASIF